MTLLSFIRLLRRNIKIMFLVAFAAASTVFYFTKDDQEQFASKTVINTGVVSGYNILNHNSDSKVDRDFSRSELQNLLAIASAYETTEELALRLLASYIILDGPHDSWITMEGYITIKSLFTDELLNNIERDNYTTAYESLKRERDKNGPSAIKDLLYSDHPFFGVEHLETIRMSLKNSSDLLEFSYKTEDPAVCQQSLIILTNIFLEKHRTLKEGQSNDVLCYFEEATATAELRLKEEEKKLLNFRTSNNIINYYEQTRFIADNKEDLDDLYFKEEMALQASKSTKDRLDEQLEERGLLSELNGKLLIKRNELSNVTNKLAMYEFLADDQKISKADLVHWETQRDYLTSEIREIAIKTQSLNFSQEGVALRDLLTEWLKAVIQIEESISRLSVINKRKQQFTQIYQQFAPWGSQLKKIERKIALAEEAYLENLHSYNQARLHLQNTLMSTNLKIIEAPYYPKSDEGSKRYMMIALAFLCGLLLPLTFLVAMEYLDQTLKNPIDAANRLELPLAGVFPLIRPKINWVPGGSKLDFIALRTRSANLIAKNLIFRSHTIKSRPNFIAISSIRGKEGASYVGNHIVRTFRSQDPVLYIVPEKKNIDLPLGDNTLTYKPSELLITVKILSKFIKKKGKKIKRYKYIVFELPSLIHNIFPATLIKQIDQMFIVCRSNRVWTNADQQIWNSLNDVLKYSPQLIINGVSPDIMEEFIGELPKKRSFIRKKIKEYIKFNFSGSSSLS